MYVSSIQVVPVTPNFSTRIQHKSPHDSCWISDVAIADVMASAMEKVLSAPELVEPILEYACSEEPYQETKNLRLVCKSWRSLALKPLYSSSGIPWFHLKIKRSSDNDTQFITDFRAKCGASLPFDLKISGHLNTAVYQFLQEFATRIVKLELKIKSDYDHEEPADDVNFQLVNLKKLSVYLELCEDYSYLNLEAFRDKILEHAKNLIFFKIEYNYGPIPSMPLPPQLTHLELCSGPSELDHLLGDNELPRFVSLDFNVQEDEDGDMYEYDMEKVNSVLEKLFRTLEELKITRREYKAYTSGPLVLPVAEKMKTLCVDVDIATIDDVLLCNALPNLTSATFTLDEWGLGDMNVFMAPGSVYQNLKSLTILYGVNLGMIGEDDILREFRTSTVPECPSLEYLKFSGFSDQVLFAALPKMFSKWTSMKRLRVGIEDNDMGDGDMSRHYSLHDLMTVLTGLRKKQVPKNEKLWTTILHDRTNSIRNLTALEKLELKVTGRCCSLGKFVFKAAFFQMEKLKSIELFGSIPVDNEMVAAWKASGREIKKDY